MPTGRSCNCSPGQTMQELTLPHALHMMEQVQHRQSILSVLGKPSHTKSATGLLYTGPSAHLARGAVLKTQCIQSVTADRPCTQCRKQYRQTDRQYRQTTQTDSIDRQHRQTVQTDSIHPVHKHRTDRQTIQTDRQRRQTVHTKLGTLVQAAPAAVGWVHGC